MKLSIKNEAPIKGEIYSVERLEEYAVFMAEQLKISEKPLVSLFVLPRMRNNGKKLSTYYRNLMEAISKKEEISPAAEWLTDNFHIVKEQLQEIQEDLPPSYYKELPKIAQGDLAGYPRVYAIALALIAHTDSQLEPETIRRFVQAYQTITPLGIGELWALAITLKIVLVENLRRTFARVMAEHKKRSHANMFADRLFEAAGNKAKFRRLVLQIPRPPAVLSAEDCAFMAQISKRLKDKEAAFWPALAHLEKILAKCHSSPEMVVNLSHQNQAANQVTVANTITSMRLLSGLDWRDFFESLSLVDRILELDPVYEKMDFLTRDRYRHVIEKWGQRNGSSEKIVAEKVVQLAQAAGSTDPTDIRRSHIGYYLLGRGACDLEKHFNFKTKTRILDFCLVNPNIIYFGLMSLLLATACVPPIYYTITQGGSAGFVLLVILLILIPCSDLALSIENLILTHAIKPKILPKMDLSMGIPENARTMVVIPCMLAGKNVIHELLEKLEVYHLGNSDPQLFFALLTDFNDSSKESLPEDEILRQSALDGIERLNLKYGSENEPRFFLFHRRRLWNSSENVWMGWERKRGKIHEFNQLLRGHQQTSFTDITAPSKLLSTIRFVITLDADTQLPRDSARKMIGTIIHPLNEPIFNKELGRVTEGYGILQPRIGVSVENSCKSFFAKIFSGYTGIDPYTTAVSDVYQDLFGEGSYTGKGLYDVDAFEAALADRVPENAILSHDLFEGLYARTGLLTDVELLDDYPQSYTTFFKRQHRWIRGDWQIARWMFSSVRNENKQWVRNRLPLISRWKIFDNLRRSLVAPFTFLWIILAWTALPGSSLVWLGYILLIIAFPSIIQEVLHSLYLRFSRRSLKMADSSAKTRITILQVFLYIALLAHQAYIQLDAIFCTIYRLLISNNRFLEWASAAQVENQKSGSSRAQWQKAWPTLTFLGALAVLLIATHSEHLQVEVSLILLWMCYPLISRLLSRKLDRKEKPLKTEDQLLFREIARRTWHYFETFANAEQNWLAPDNHQEFPDAVTAPRTSPTNMGLYLLAIISAQDFGYISAANFIDRLQATFGTMRKLEKYHGHFLNWYDTQNLQPLIPKYVSTVDSGNLAAYLLTTKQACLEIPECAAIESKSLDGLRDTLLVISREIKVRKGETSELSAEIDSCLHFLSMAPLTGFTAWADFLQSLHPLFVKIKEDILKIATKHPLDHWENILKWSDLALNQLKEMQTEIALRAPWVAKLSPTMGKRLQATSLSISMQWNELVEHLDRDSSLQHLVQVYEEAMEQLQKMIPEISETDHVKEDLRQFSASLKQAQDSIRHILLNANSLAQEMDQAFNAMNFQFLLAKDRDVFTIGYSVTDEKFDRGLFDLLASESRVASFIAIAKDDVPQEHWFRLGRQLVGTSAGHALVSWTASMFEYLMPFLVMRDYNNTLLSETAHTVVRRQIEYGHERKVPWGISEAGYNARDLQLNYQYGPFGIPGLGLKRGLGHDLVISPYSTMLAAMVNPRAALHNIKVLLRKNLLQEYGFYESIDYTPERIPENKKFAVIQSFMAHHQGMSLVAINNVLHKNIMQNRFHCDPRVRASRLLLQERIPQGFLFAKAAEKDLDNEHFPKITPLTRDYVDPNTPIPRIQLLSNRSYSVMISTAGSGYSKCQDLGVTRWKEDGTRDNWGSFIFVRDMTQGTLWSTTYQPLNDLPDSYKVTFRDDKVEFRRRDGDISTYTQILVAPEDNVEIRHVTLTNHSDKPRIIELTSYLELVLGSSASDSDHPAFSKLFIQTEFISLKKAILAKRRKRASDDNEIWGLHVVVTDGETLDEIQYETDRSQFIGRGRNLMTAQALSPENVLSNTSGATLDPIMSLRIKVQIPTSDKVQISFATGLTSSREQALELADRYHDIHSFDRERKLAWTKSQADINHLNVNAETAYLYQRLAERILYTDPTLRPVNPQKKNITDVQAHLWPNGISGDLPMVVVRIADQRDLAAIRKLLRCHEYLRMKGLIYDFIILNEQETTYLQDLQNEIQQLIRSTGSHGWFNKRGGVFALRTDITSPDTIAHIRRVARISISADIPLKDQISRKIVAEKLPAALSFTKNKRFENNTAVPPVPELDFFNGSGGFSKNGQEYVIRLQPGKWTPAPWLNVVANKKGFGFQVSETGSGFTWSINSQKNRLTPWSNDPVSDSPGEIIYLRDDETGELWSPTPLPLRGEAPFTIRHGHGYSIFEKIDHGFQQTLTLFIPQEDSVKISLLKLRNLSKRPRKISVTSYTEWVLGSQREKTSPYLVCEVDPNSGAIFAINPHDNDFTQRTAFTHISSAKQTFTCSRMEFLGRNGNYMAPAALARESLSNRPETGQDPCAALQVCIELRPGEEKEICILLGQGESSEEAHDLIRRYGEPEAAQNALDEVVNSWRDLLEVIQVQTPDPGMDVLMNGWLLYQTLSCRYWARNAFYQSGGAYGFRDQLQDCMAFVYAAPHLTKEHILRASARQFKEGDVQHWWHPPLGRGIRTRISDDLLWLPFVVSFYIRATGDKSILDQVTPFLEAPLLVPGQEDSYALSPPTAESATLFEHCLRAINRSLTLGEHDLPLIGTGDWNDGMNRVGSHGKGESIWLGWFQYKVLADFLLLCDQPEQKENREKFQAQMEKLKMALAKDGWDGDRYRRAYYDDGTPMGSAQNEECKIDSIAQSWSVLSGASDEVRAKQAMLSLEEHLVLPKAKLVLLLTPPFDKSPQEPGYIKGYVPGVRENGGQYTHAAVWAMMAFAELGEGNKAFNIFNMLNPIIHARNETEANKYKIEPYVLAGDVYAEGSLEGRGGWSWYTGSASWYYRAALESLLGFKLQGNILKVTPCIPDTWKSYSIKYKFARSLYSITVNNPKMIQGGITSVKMDGQSLPTAEARLIDDGENHTLIFTIEDTLSNPLESRKPADDFDSKTLF